MEMANQSTVLLTLPKGQVKQNTEPLNTANLILINAKEVGLRSPHGHDCDLCEGAFQVIILCLKNIVPLEMHRASGYSLAALHGLSTFYFSRTDTF